MDAGFVGRVYPPTAPYAVGREHLRDFAQAVGATHPVHSDVEAARAAGYADIVATPTFAVVIAQRAEAQLIEDPAAGIDFSRVVHAEERFTHRRPIVAGDEITTVLHVDAIVERGGLAMVTTRCELTDATGSPVASVLSTLAVRGAEA
ncbi:MaoC family dehydratase N-terminal domain-containing protein [Actinotalea sp.]|uniref:FAS1-like dehydratase domain-containing protein n=1 Tax=Actinotalea sp. TaxID=1872145 RepID=UPI0035641819